MLDLSWIFPIKRAEGLDRSGAKERGGAHRALYSFFIALGAPVRKLLQLFASLFALFLPLLLLLFLSFPSFVSSFDSTIRVGDTRWPRSEKNNNSAISEARGRLALLLFFFLFRATNSAGVRASSISSHRLRR